jgi:hypothetical protein
MPAFNLLPEANDDLDEMAGTELERFGIVLVLGLALLTVLMVGALFYLY